MTTLVSNQNFDWNIVWEEIVKQDKDTENTVFRNILYNIDELVQQGSASTPFYKKLLTKTIDEAICNDN
jgi:hypothetical protein